MIVVGLTARSVTKVVVLSSLVIARKGVSYPAAIEPTTSPTPFKGHLAFYHSSPDITVQGKEQSVSNPNLIPILMNSKEVLFFTNLRETPLEYELKRL